MNPYCGFGNNTPARALRLGRSSHQPQSARRRTRNLLGVSSQITAAVTGGWGNRIVGMDGFLTAADLPALMSGADERGVMTPVAQFVKDWNNSTDAGREASIRTAPVSSDNKLLAAVAAVVHALAVRDDVTVPAWVTGHVVEPMSISGVDLSSDYGKLLVANTPVVAAGHGVFFDEDLLALR